MHLAGVAIPDRIVLELGRRLRTAGLEATAAKLEHAWSAESMVLALDIDDREALLRAMEDWCPWGRPIASDSQRYDWSTIEERGLGVDLNAIAR